MTSRVRSIFLAALLLVPALVGSVAAAEPEPVRPNILFILTDDQRWDALGVMGNSIIRTPNLDRLAGQGVLFQNARVTTSICCVSRASILSGQYESRHGIHDFSATFTPEAWDRTYPALLARAGYKVGFVGKLGVGNKPPQRFDFMKVGSDSAYTFPDGPGKTIHQTDLVTRQADEFLDRFAGKPEPFCLAIGFKAPHELDGDPPLYPVQDRFASLYDSVTIPSPPATGPGSWESWPDFFRTERNLGRKRWRGLFGTPELFQSNVKNYYRLISGVDDAVGHLLGRLQKLGVAERTVIVFASDNGFTLGEHGLEGKWFGHEESIRVPLFIVDPRSAPGQRGRTSDLMALNIDLAPTILHLAGVEAPSSMQGCDLFAMLAGRVEPRREFFYEHTYLGSPGLPKVEGVVTPDLKYMKFIEHGYEQLHDLRHDPHETVNLATDPAHADELRAMRERYEVLKAGVK
ncbi:MAG: sulfatase [Luteolibacter sp.]